MKITILIKAMLIAGITVSSCQTLDPYTREEKTSQATKGALIGAAAGIVVGLVAGAGIATILGIL